MRIDEEIDFHEHSRAAMLDRLNIAWGSRRWDGMRRVKIIHGNGAVLWMALRSWAEDRGIPWSSDAGNSGVTILHPANRVKPATPAIAHKPLAQRLQNVPRVPTPKAKPPKVVDAAPVPPRQDQPDEDLFRQAIDADVPWEFKKK